MEPITCVFDKQWEQQWEQTQNRSPKTERTWGNGVSMGDHREETQFGMPEAQGTPQCSALANHKNDIAFSEMILWNENQARESLS